MITESTSIERIGAAAILLSKYQILNFSQHRSFDSTVQEEQVVAKIFGASVLEDDSDEWGAEALNSAMRLSIEAIKGSGGRFASDESIPIEARKRLFIGQVIIYIKDWLEQRGGDKTVMFRLVVEADDAEADD